MSISPGSQHRPPEPPVLALVEDPVLMGDLGVLAHQQLGLLTHAQVAAHGVSRSAVRHRLDTHRWRRPTRGVLDVGATPPVRLPHHHRSVRSAVLGLLTYGPTGTAAGTSALALHGVWGVPPGSPPCITLPGPSARAQRDGIRCRRLTLHDPVELVHGFRVTSVADALAQAVPEATPRTALGLLDSARHRGLISADGLATVHERTRGARGCRRLTSTWPLVDARRESPFESWAYADLSDADLTPTDVQVPIPDRYGRVLARADLGYELDDGSWHLVELDGAEHHGDAGRDESRDNRLTVAVLGTGRRATITRYRSRHLGPRGSMVREIGALLAGRTWTAPRPRG